MSLRLVPFLPELVAVLERQGEVHLEPAIKEPLLALSAATADRLRRTERERSHLHGLSTRNPGTLLRATIPIRTGTDWQDAEVGCVEVDLVAHCGESVTGEDLFTRTDLLTGWTECLAVPNRGHQAVFRASVQARTHLPFPLRGIDADNGVEFLNTPRVALLPD